MGNKNSGRRPYIIDEYTERTDLSNFQKYKLRHPEKWNVIKSVNQKRRWEQMSPERRIENNSWKIHKLRYPELKQMFENQFYKCTICNNEVTLDNNKNTRGVVDHCHTSKKIRSILCHNCNRSLGLMKENIESLKNMINYIELHNV